MRGMFFNFCMVSSDTYLLCQFSMFFHKFLLTDLIQRINFLRSPSFFIISITFVGLPLTSAESKVVVRLSSTHKILASGFLGDLLVLLESLSLSLSNSLINFLSYFSHNSSFVFLLALSPLEVYNHK